MRIAVFLVLSAVIVSCKKEFPDLNTKVIGHAGESLIPARSKYSPNSLKSVEYAIEQGVEGVEVDVQMTTDSILVVYHDLRLDDNSSGSGCINSKTYQELSNVTIYKSDDKIDSLYEYFEATIEKGAEIFLDVKHYNECEDKIIDYEVFNRSLNRIIENWSAEERELITVNSSNINLLKALTDTSVQISFESDLPDNAVPLILENGFETLTIKLSEIDQQTADLLKTSNIKLAIYNVKIRSEIYRALELAPDFVISDNISCTIKSIHG